MPGIRGRLLSVSEDDVVRHLTPVVPRVQLLVERAVGQLGGVGVRVGERQAGHGVRERVRVEGVGDVGVAPLHAVHGVEHAAHQEAVPEAAAPESRPEALDGLQVSVAQVDEEGHFLVEALRVQSRVEQPQAGLVHRKLQLKDRGVASGLRN